jgi:hypothetical protein
MCQRGNIIYRIDTHLKGITPLEIDAFSSAGNVEAFGPGTIFVPLSNDVGVGHHDQKFGV